MPTARTDATRYVFGSHRTFRKVTVYSRQGRAHAEGLAAAELERRTIDAGQEVPVSWDLYVVAEPAPNQKQLTIPGLQPVARQRARKPKRPPGWPFKDSAHFEKEKP